MIDCRAAATTHLPPLSRFHFTTLLSGSIMNQPSPELLERLRAATELRAAGLSWEVVAGRVGSTVGTCSRWPSRYRDVWHSLMREAVRLTEQESAIEARATLRMILRGDDDKKKISAAQQLLRPAKPRPRDRRAIQPEDRALAAFISQVRSLSDDELDRLTREFLAEERAAAGVEVPASAT